MTTTDTTDKSLFAVHQHNGATNYYLDGELHRLGGPAVEYTSGKVEWWVGGHKIKFKEWLTRIPDDQQIFMAMRYGNNS